MNLFDTPEHLPEELVEQLVSGENVRVERIVSKGHRSPEGFWYDQDEDEWVVLLTGSATLAWEHGRRQLLQAGDALFIPAHERHRVEETSEEPPCVWLAVFGKSLREG